MFTKLSRDPRLMNNLHHAAKSISPDAYFSKREYLSLVGLHAMIEAAKKMGDREVATEEEINGIKEN